MPTKRIYSICMHARALISPSLFASHEEVAVICSFLFHTHGLHLTLTSLDNQLKVDLPTVRPLCLKFDVKLHSITTLINIFPGKALTIMASASSSTQLAADMDTDSCRLRSYVSTTTCSWSSARVRLLPGSSRIQANNHLKLRSPDRKCVAPLEQSCRS